MMMSVAPAASRGQKVSGRSRRSCSSHESLALVVEATRLDEHAARDGAEGLAVNAPDDLTSFD
jgi:hypothetical protein